MLGPRAHRIIGHDPQKVLERIQAVVLDQTRQSNNIYQQILRELSEHDIHILNETQLNSSQGKFVTEYFDRKVRPRLFPIMINQRTKFPELKELSIYLAVILARSDARKKPKYALIEVPSMALPRFVVLPTVNGSQYVILLDDIIRYSLGNIFSTFNHDQFSAYTIKITRDAELDMDNDFSQSLVKKLRQSLKQRTASSPVRLVYDAEMPDELLTLLKRKIRVKRHDTVIPGARYHNFKDFVNFPQLGNGDLVYKHWPALPHKDLINQRSLFKRIQKKDILLHFPYQSFNYILDLLREASLDPKVTSIRITHYRVASNSSIINALINAVKNGKNVTVVMELQARFDEEANLAWANLLREGGVQVIYGVPGLKVHSKIALITRREKGVLVHYGLIGTGNFNESTATLYTDHVLFTANKEITQEINRVFRFFQNNYQTGNFRHLVVAPFQHRKVWTQLIENEIENAKAGREAYIHLKLNKLADVRMIKLLYKASKAGVQIRLIVRGMFSLMTEHAGMSDNIEAISIVDKFLEHTRILCFCNGGDEKIFLSSADWLERNLDRRVEVAAPIYDQDIKNELRAYFDLQWGDNLKARILDATLTNKHRNGRKGKAVRSQLEIYRALQKAIEPAKRKNGKPAVTSRIRTRTRREVRSN